jgi:hypothetical protein
MFASLAVMAGLYSPTAAAGDLDGTVSEAVAVHVTNQGLAQLGDIVEALVPSSFLVEAGGGSFACDDSGDALSYTLSDLDLLIGVDEVELTAADGALLLTLYGTLSSSAASLDVSGDCSILQDLSETCGVQLPVTALQADLQLDIVQTDDGFDVTASPVVVDISPIGNPLSACTLASAAGTLLGQNPDAISDLILDNIEPSLESLPQTIEDALEGILADLAFETSFELLPGIALGIVMSPALLELSEAGLVVGLGAEILGGDSNPCVDSSAGPQLGGGGWPTFSEQAAGTSLTYDAGVFVGRDFVDHLLWSTWGSGALCLELEDLNGAALTTGLMASFFGDEVAILFGDAEPALLSIVPNVAPYAVFSDDQPPVAIGLEQLGVEMFTRLDGRALRALRVDIDGEVGVNIALTEGILESELVLDEGSLGYSETYSELLWPGFSAELPSLVDLVLGSFLPEDLLPTVTIPYLLGAELSAVAWHPTPDGDWQGGYVLLETDNVTPLKLGGCSASSIGCGEDSGGIALDLDKLLGCSSSESGFGCEDSGCAAGGTLFLPTSRMLPALMVLIGALIRRRA